MSTDGMSEVRVRPSNRIHVLMSVVADVPGAHHFSLEWDSGWTVKVHSARGERLARVFTVNDTGDTSSGGQHRARVQTYRRESALDDPTLLIGELIDDEAERMLWALSPDRVFNALLFTDVAALPESATAGPDGQWWMRVRYENIGPHPKLLGWPLVDRNRNASPVRSG